MMTSESSSAVLDMNEVDTEETEPPSFTEDIRDMAPLVMEHGYDIVVKVDAPMRQLSTLETFVTYRVRCVCARWPTPPYVRRRYNNFKLLHKRLSEAHPLIATPPLPPLHSARQQLDRYSLSFIAIRTLALHAFLDRVAKHPILTYSDDFRIFLCTPDDELEKVFKNENSALNLWGLGNVFYGSGEAKVANGARVKDPEFTAASEYLQSLQEKLTTLCTLTTKLHKGTSALGVEMMGMKRACDLWSCQERGGVARAGGACGCGALAAGRAVQRAQRTPPAHRATLPMLAAYAHAHADKIHARDAIHATYVSGANTNDVHNRLEQASEALRSELSDWMPKTRTDIKNVLLDLATRQVDLQTQMMMGWEHALKLSTDANIDEMFKTVSKSAVQNLSPSKYRSPNETDRDLDDFEDVSNDSDSREALASDYGNAVFDFGPADSELDVTKSNAAASQSKAVDDNGTLKSKVGDNADRGDLTAGALDSSDRTETGNGVAREVSDAASVDAVNSGEESGEAAKNRKMDLNVLAKVGHSKQNVPNDIAKAYTAMLSSVDTDAACANNVTMQSSVDFLNDILNDKEVEVENGSKVSGTSFKDPLSEFTDVDLS